MSRPTRLLKAEGVRLARPSGSLNGTVVSGRLPDGRPDALAADGPHDRNGQVSPRPGRPEPGGPPGAEGHELPEAPALRAGDGSGGPRGGLRLRDRRVLEAARRRARALLQHARASARQLQERAREEGLRQGFEEGLAQGRQEAAARALGAVRQVVERLQEVVRQAEEQRRQALDRLEADVVELALAVAEKVIRQQVAEGPRVTLAVLRSVLADHLPAASGRVRVRIHPSEYHRLQDERGRWAVDVPGPVQVEFLPDPGVEPGGCLVESDLGLFDAGLQTRLGLVGMTLMDGVRGAGG